MSIGGVLLVLFVVLKLAGLISWSWWLVLAPLYGTLALIIVYCVRLGWNERS